MAELETAYVDRRDALFARARGLIRSDPAGFTEAGRKLAELFPAERAIEDPQSDDPEDGIARFSVFQRIASAASVAANPALGDQIQRGWFEFNNLRDGAEKQLSARLITLAILLGSDDHAHEVITPEICELGALPYETDDWAELGRNWVDWTEHDWAHGNDPSPRVLDRLERSIWYLVDLHREIRDEIAESVEEIGPFHAWLRFSSWNNILSAHIAGYRARGENSARAMAQGLVKIELPTLRTMAENAFPATREPRIAVLMNDLEDAAWDLVQSIDGVSPDKIVQNGMMMPGPWVGHIQRLTYLGKRVGFTSVAVGIGHEPSDPPSRGGMGGNSKPLTPADRSFLVALCRASGPKYGNDLAATAGYTDFRGPLRRLCEYGYATKPSRRSGYLVTEEGRKACASQKPP